VTGAIDIWVNPFTEDATERMAASAIQDIADLVGEEGLYQDAGQTPAEFVDYMDAYNVDMALIPSLKFDGDNNPRDGVKIPESLVADICEENPDRFKGLVGIDPFTGMEGVHRLERYVEEHGFVGAHIVPHGFHLPTNHRRYYPFYAKCAELDIPVIIQIGHTAVRMPNDPGRPKYLDDIALEFPSLDIVAANIGWPWTTEATALAWTHPNVYISTTGHSPQYWETEFVDFVRGRGQDKVIWGTSYPTIEIGETLAGVSDLNLGTESERKLLSENARRVFNL
jgi:predicted TIM-barrel fold metal-dependent hydrolase